MCGDVGLQVEGEKKIGAPRVTHARGPPPLRRPPSPPAAPFPSDPMAPRRPGMALGVWGPAAWNTLHAFAHAAPARLTEAAATRGAHFLAPRPPPVPRCRRHFAPDARRARAPLRTRGDLVRLLHDAHNEVNVRTGKRALTLAEHYALYSTAAPPPRRPRPRRRRAAPSELAAAAVLVAAVVSTVRTKKIEGRRDNRPPPRPPPRSPHAGFQQPGPALDGPLRRRVAAHLARSPRGRCTSRRRGRRRGRGGGPRGGARGARARLTMWNLALALFHGGLAALTLAVGNVDLAVPVCKTVLDFRVLNATDANGTSAPTDAWELVPSYARSGSLLHRAHRRLLPAVGDLPPAQRDAAARGLPARARAVLHPHALGGVLPLGADHDGAHRVHARRARPRLESSPSPRSSPRRCRTATGWSSSAAPRSPEQPGRARSPTGSRVGGRPRAAARRVGDRAPPVLRRHRRPRPT